MSNRSGIRYWQKRAATTSAEVREFGTGPDCTTQTIEAATGNYETSNKPAPVHFLWRAPKSIGSAGEAERA